MRLVYIRELRQGMVVAHDIPSSEAGAAPLVRKNTPLTYELIDSMYRHKIRFVYIDETATRKRREFESAVARQPVVPKAKPVISRKLREEAVDSLKTVFGAISIDSADVHASSQIVRHLDTVVGQLVDSLVQNRKALVNISDLKSYDDYTYHHSLSVAVLAIAIGQRMGFDRGELHRLGTCAIMHDIGKTAVPIELIHKPSRLSDEEFSIIKKHSPAGYDYLTKTALGDEEIRRGVLSHHEKQDGTGYPGGLKGEEIPLWSRIISVADVYDALTSNRPYRSPMQPAEALEYIMGGVGRDFDYDTVYAFVKKVELYPVGSFLELSNGKSAVVLNTSNHMRPVVRFLDTGEVADLYGDRRYLNVVVTRMLPDPLPLSPA